MEFALALTLLAGAGLLIHSFWKLTRVDLGFRQDHLLTFSLPVRHGRFANSGQIAVFYRELLAKIAALPGISSASASTGMPILGTSSGVPFSIPGQPFNDPFWQSPWPNAGIAVRTAGDPSSVANSIAAIVQSMDSDLPLDRVRTMDQLVDESLAGDRFATALLASFAVIALILAAIGIYGVMSFSVAQQTHEIGLRMALGAGPGQVLFLVLRDRKSTG